MARNLPSKLQEAENRKDILMASSMIAISTSSAVPHFEPFTGAQIKASSPYGLPIVDNCLSCKLRNSNFFCSLSQSSIEALDDIKHATSYPEGAVVFMEGQAARGVYILCQGRVKMMATNPEGRTLILKIAEPGEVLGLHSVVSGKPHELTVETLQPSQLAFIGREDFLKFLRAQGDACLRAAQHISRDCQAAYGVIRSIGLSHSVSEKMARLLLQWSADGRVSDGVVRVKVALTHEEMAQLIGSSRETVTRTLGEFKKQRIAELVGSTLVVLNKAVLEKLALG
jgi:CRP/FNR family cyclic AMP-dependent transcriptional regulator